MMTMLWWKNLLQIVHGITENTTSNTSTKQKKKKKKKKKDSRRLEIF